MAHLCVDDEAMAFTTRQELQLGRFPGRLFELFLVRIFDRSFDLLFFPDILEEVVQQFSC